MYRRRLAGSIPVVRTSSPAGVGDLYRRRLAGFSGRGLAPAIILRDTHQCCPVPKDRLALALRAICFSQKDGTLHQKQQKRAVLREEHKQSGLRRDLLEAKRYSVSKFTEEELEYLRTQRLGRLATVNERGEPQIAPVGFRYNAEFDTIDIGGLNNGASQKFRNVARNGLAAFVVDDVLPPWQPRCIEIRGHAEALSEGGQAFGPHFSPEIIRLTPKRIISWDASTKRPRSSRTVG